MTSGLRNTRIWLVFNQASPDREVRSVACDVFGRTMSVPSGGWWRIGLGVLHGWSSFGLRVAAVPEHPDSGFGNMASTT